MTQAPVAWLKLYNFRCHKQLEVNVTDALILLKGDSGAGKSSIFIAIEWAMYGGRVDVLPTGEKANKHLKCAVELVLPAPDKKTMIHIYRERSPHNKLMLKPNAYLENKLDDVPAQAFINSCFGTEELWLTTSYISQKSFNYMITATNGEKLSLLNQLAFQQEDPELKIQQITDKCEKESSELKSLESAYNQELAIFNHDSQTAKLSPDWNLNEQRCNEVMSQFQLLQQQLPSLQQECMRTTQIKAQIAYIESCITSLKARLIDPDGYGQNESFESRITELRKKQRIYLDYNLTWSKKDSLQQELAAFVRSDVEVKLSDITDARVREANFDTRINTCKFFNLQSKETVEERIKQLDSSFQQVPTQKLILRKKALLQEFNNTPKVSQDRIDEIDTQLTQIRQLDASNTHLPIQLSECKRTLESELRDLSTILNCPSCTANLRMHQGKLCTATISPGRNISQLQTEVKDVDKKISEVMNGLSLNRILKSELEDRKRNLLQKQERYKQLRSELDSLSHLPDELTTRLPTANDESELSSLRNLLITWCEAPQVTSSKLQQIYNLQLKHKELDAVNNLLKDVPRIPIAEYRQIEQDLQNLEYKRKLQEEQRSIRQQLQEQQNQLSSLLSKCPNITEVEVKSNQDMQNSLNSQLHYHNLYKTFLIRSKSLQDRYNALLEKQKRVTIWTEFKNKAIEVEYATLEIVTENINNIVAEVLSAIFDEPIQATLNTVRELKSGKQKFQVNLAIVHEGCPKEFKHLSGGEKDRVSLALTLAFSHLSSFPLILMDECMDSLGVALKDICLKQIRKGSKGKSTLMVDIGHIEGLYDSCIHVKKG